MVTKTAHLNIRMTQAAADALKVLAESERLPLGEVIQLLLDRFQPTPRESVIDEWKVEVEARINELEQQIKVLSSGTKVKASRRVEACGNSSPGPEAVSFQDAVLQLYQAGTTSFQEIAEQLEERGYRNSNGNPYHRKQVARIITSMSPPLAHSMNAV